jgi:DNA-binding protein H-NS
MNLNSYSLQDLVKLRREATDEELRREVDEEIRARHTRDPESTEYHLRDLAREWGTAVADLMSGFAPENRDEVKPERHRYEHPFDPRLTWSGIGAKPGWVREWEAKGHSLSELEAGKRHGH